MPTSRTTPMTGGNTLSHRPRQSYGMRLMVSTTAGLVGVGSGAALTAREGSLLEGNGTGVVSSGEWNTAETMVRSPATHAAGAARTLNESAYLAGSLPSHTTPSISLLERIGSFGTLTFIAEATCVYSSIWLICFATPR